MDKREAREGAAAVLEDLRVLPYAELVSRLLNQVDARDVVAASGNSYQVEVEAWWDDQEAGHLRVMASADQGGRRSGADSFIVAPDGSLLGE